MLTIILLAPVPLGSNRPRFWFGLESVVFGVMVLFCLTQAFAQSAGTLTRHRALLSLFALWVLYLALQLVPLPGAVLGTLSPMSLDIQMMSRPGAGLYSVSVQSFATLEELMKRVMYLSAFTLCLVLPRRKVQLSTAVYAIILFAVLQSVYALIQYSYDPEGHLKGTFTNKNHFALYIAIALALTTGAYLANLHGERGGEASEGRRAILSGYTLLTIGLVLFLVPMVLLTQSKGAVLSFFVGMIFTYFFLRDAHMHRAFIVFVPVAGAALFAVIWVGGSSLFSRYTLSQVLRDERVLQWTDSLRLAGDFWLTGSGGATYKYVFPAYKNFEYRPLFYDHVHNDYLEYLCNDGLLGLLPLMCVLGLWLFSMRKEYRARRNPYIRGMAFGIVLAVSTIMAHGFVDYNLQVPSNALMLFSLMGLGLAAVRIDKTVRSRARR